MWKAHHGGQINPNVFFGNREICLFELNDAGTILYCRSNQQSNRNLTEFVGHNLFDEIASFENIQELRRRVRYFVKSDDATQKFPFDFQISNKTIPTKLCWCASAGNLTANAIKRQSWISEKYSCETTNKGKLWKAAQIKYIQNKQQKRIGNSRLI